jgi:hypothetical protein
MTKKELKTYFSAQKKKQKFLKKFTDNQRMNWYQQAILFVKTKTNIEIEFVKDCRSLRNSFFNSCKIKDGKLLILLPSAPQYCWDQLYQILHEAGHLASIPIEHRHHLDSRLKPRIKYQYNGFWKGFMELEWGNESLAQYWSRCVATKLGIPIIPFNFFFSEPYKNQQLFLDNFGDQGYYSAKKIGFSTTKFILNKNNI